MFRRLPAFLALSAVVVLPLRASAQADALKALFEGAGSVETADRELSADAKAKLSAALEGDFKPEADGKVVVATAKKYPNPLGDPETLDAAWAVAATSGEAKVALIVFRDASQKDALTVAAAQLLAPEAAKDDEPLAAMLKSLEWRTVAKNAYEPLSGFLSRKAAADAGADDAAKQMKLLLALLHDMHEIESDIEAIDAAAEDGNAEAAVRDARHLAHEFEEAKKVFEQSDFVLGAKAAADKPLLFKHADKALADAGAAQKAAEGKDLKAMAKLAGKISCSGCHGDFKKRFIAKREEFKIGDGFFIPGHDLPHPKGDGAALAKSIGAAARKALLTLDQVTR